MRQSLGISRRIRVRDAIICLACLGWMVGSAAFGLAQTPPPSSGGEETIGVETNLVIVPISVRDGRDRFVRGLTRRDFVIREDRIPQPIVDFRASEHPFAAAILLDTSGSMERKLALLRAACAQFIEGFRVGDRFALFSFGNGRVRQLQDFTEERELADAVWDLEARGQTPLYDAILLAAERLSQQPEERRILLVVSDGADTESRTSFDQALRRCLDAHLAVYAVDMSDQAVFGRSLGPDHSSSLRELTARSGGQFFRTPGGNLLRDAFAATIEELHHQYTLTYSPLKEQWDGRWRRIEVQVERPGTKVRTRQGYWARKRPR
jgi:Ca-activated chloride channel family protein